MSTLLVRLAAVIGLLLCLLWPGPAAAAPAPAPGTGPEPEAILTVAVKSAPPFAIRDANGEWGGTSIELWREIAAELNLHYQLHETTLADMIDGVADGRYQVAVAALTITAEREQRIDFTHPFYTTGLAIAVSSEGEPAWRGVIQAVFSSTFLGLIAVLALIQLVVGTLVWVFERRANEQFPNDPVQGVSAGFWWATVTMTTVGYGDKAPRTVLGRTVALLWMLASMVIIASVTATIASSLTVEKLDARIRGPEDLHRFEVGVITATTGAAFLREEKIIAHEFTDADAALAALVGGEIQALVWDAPLLREAIANDPALGIEMVGGVFQRQDYAIAVGEGSELREAINRVLPEKARALDLAE